MGLISAYGVTEKSSEVNVTRRNWSTKQIAHVPQSALTHESISAAYCDGTINIKDEEKVNMWDILQTTWCTITVIHATFLDFYLWKLSHDNLLTVITP